MSKNIDQIFITNPITTNVGTDLMYFGRSPYGITNDAAMDFTHFSAQFVPIANLTVGGPVTFTGAHTFNAILTANTTVTFPTSGTLATTAQIPVLPTVPFIVGASGPYTTIQAAINAAAAVATITQQQMVLINPGTYTENLTLMDFVHLSCFGASDIAVTINGNATYTSSVSNGILSLNCLSFTTTAGGTAALIVAGSSTCVLNMDNCTFTAQTAPCFACSNSNATIFKSNSTDFAAAGQFVFNLSAGTITVNGCEIVSTDTPSVMSGGTLEILGGFVTDAFVLTNGAGVFITSSVIESNNSLSTFTIGAGAEVIVVNSTIACNAPSGFWATGTGTIIYNSLTTALGSASQIDPAVANLDLPLLIGNLSFDGGITTLSTTGQMIFGRTSDVPLIAPLSGDATVSNTGALTITSINGHAVTLAGAVTFAGAFTTVGAFAVTQTYTATTNVTFPTSGTLATTSQLPNAWVDQTTPSVTMVTNTGYTSDDGATLVTFTLPTTSAIGDFVEINGKGAGLWKIAQIIGQQIHFGTSTTTSGATGSLASVNQYDCIRLRCLTANTIWVVVSAIGNLTVV